MSRLFAACYGLFFLGMDLAMPILGKLGMGLVVSSAIVRIGLL